MRSYFWHIIIALGLFALFVFGGMIFAMRFSNDITFTDEELITAPSITIVDPRVGNENAPITIVLYSDYACPSCANVEQMLVAFLVKHPQDVRLVWKDMPNETRHAQAMPAAIAARCAGKQEKFWEYHDALFAQQSALSPELYLSLATALNLDSPSFSSCIEKESTRPLVERTLAEGLALQVTATPTLFINGQRFTGSLSQAEIERVLTAELAK